MKKQICNQVNLKHASKKKLLMALSFDFHQSFCLQCLLIKNWKDS